MPASTLDPVSAALRNALTKNSSEDFLSSQLSGSSRRVLSTNIEFESTESYQSTVLNNLKSKYIVLQGNKQTAPSRKQEMGADETIATPQRVLYPLEAVQLGWNNSEWSVGAGMVNMGNTCYLNSTLQALFHVPALVNWLLSDKQHMDKCEDSGGGQGGCIICAMTKTLQASQQRNTNAIRPWLVFSKLRIVCRHLVPGRQEDAHEFLRYLVEAMERAYIQRFRNLAPLDTRSKETTPLNQILGGYLRSTVRCLECGHVSTTFQHFQDLLLDIRKVNTLDDALDLYFSREKLDDMAYHCENCQKKVLATKQFSLERAPMVLCIQLKRFSVTNNKITKHITFRQRLELTQFARRKSSPPLVYRLVSLVTHVGQTVGCGHYTAVAQAPTGNFYQFDDSMVRPISQQAVFNTNAYIMLYELECSHTTSSPKSSIVCKNYNKSVQNSDNNTSAHLTKESTSSPQLNNALSSSSSHLNGLCLPKSSNSVTAHGPSFSQNGNGRCVNGADKHNSDSSSDSDESEPVSSVPQNASQRTNKSSSYSASLKSTTCAAKSTTNSSNSSLSLLNSSLNSPKTASKESDSVLPVNSTTISNSSHQQQQQQQQSTMKKHCSNNAPNGSSSTSNNGSGNSGDGDGGSGGPSERKQFKQQFQEINNVSSSSNSSSTGNTNSQPMTKLVPYEVDDSSCSAEESPANAAAGGTAEPSSKLQIVTKAGSWQVSPTKNTFHKPSLEGQAGWNRQQREAVTELMHMSHEGYSAPVSTWNGTRAALDREINNERREDRKRAMVDNPDKGKVKQAKHSNNSYIGSGNNKSNPGYNAFQEYSNARKWQNDSHFYGKSSHYNSMRHRYHQRRGNYHNNHRHRDKFKH